MSKKTNIDQTDTIELTDEQIGINRLKIKEGLHSLKIRTISSIIMLILLLFFIVSGAIYTSLINTANVKWTSYISIFCATSLIGFCSFEMNRANKFNKWYSQLIIIIFVMFLYLFPVGTKLYAFSFYIDLKLASWLQGWIFPILLSLFILVVVGLGVIEKNDLKLSIINSVMSFVIIFGLKAFSISSLNLYTIESVQKATFSFNTIIWIWLMIILADSFAYIGGMAYGKTKLAPNISPKKTWEGAAIGLSISTIIGIIYPLIFLFTLNDYKPLNLPIELLYEHKNGIAITILMYVLLAIIFPIIGLFGDLLFSWVKRNSNIKDYSNLIPGHGGALDRLDSILFALCILFFILIFTI